MLLGCIAVATCAEIKWGQCKGSDKQTAEITSVSIEPCAKFPCFLIKGGTTTMTIKFKPTNDITKLDTEVHGKVGFAWWPFKLDDSDAFHNTGLTAPLKAGEEYTYTFSLPVSSLFPSLKVVVSWELKDQNKDNVICFVFPTKLVTKPTKE